MSGPARARSGRERTRPLGSRLGTGRDSASADATKKGEGQTMEGHRISASQIGESALQPLTKRALDGMINDAAAEVVAIFEGVAPVRLNSLGDEILAIPMDTRRFLRLMSRYISLN